MRDKNGVIVISDGGTLLIATANAVRVGDHPMERMDVRQPESEPAHVG